MKLGFKEAVQKELNGESDADYEGLCDMLRVIKKTEDSLIENEKQLKEEEYKNINKKIGEKVYDTL